ncbi:MAG: lipoyl(octanoyl) transferase LipB [Pseudomonadota bacterium]|nr:lipoyl(octanoyl) transferase LipB [Pseudomonadota bacterium]
MRWRWLGRVPYVEALAAQRAHRDALGEGRVGQEVWLLEHDPVVTTGRRGVFDLDPARIAAAGYDLAATERGGLATCHEPGQLVGYVLIDAREIGVRRTIATLEGAIVEWLGTQGVMAGPREGYPGVWVGSEKLCAVGLHFRGGLTLHGFALNLVNDLRGFGLITPCGIRDGGVTTLARLVGTAPAPAAAAAAIGEIVVRRLLDAAVGSVNRVGPEGT